MRSKIWGLTTVMFTTVVGIIFAVNALIIVGFSPEAAQRWGIQSQGVTAIYTDNDLSASSLLSMPATGYVNIMNPDSTMYITINPDRTRNFNSFMINHEAFHLVQKEHIARRAGGYPSVWNPVRTVRFLDEAWKLNKELEAVMPAVDASKWNRFTAGLEAAADCAGQHYSFSQGDQQDTLRNGRKTTGFYVQDECTWDQHRIVEHMINDSSYRGKTLDALAPDWLQSPTWLLEPGE